jgi:DNA polymerase III gamma/tau subunit
MTLVGNVQLVAGSKDTLPAVLAILEREGIAPKRNPDLYVRAHVHFGIEDARSLRDRASHGAITGGRRVFVVVAASMTVEAQNALLKTIEEPSGNALFVFIIPSPDILLPTVRSRSQILELAGDNGVQIVDEKKFLGAQPSARLEMLKPLLEKGEEDRRDVGSIISFLSSLERRISAVKSPDVKASIEAIYRARKHISDKGALVKPLLEQVALLTPKI